MSIHNSSTKGNSEGAGATCEICGMCLRRNTDLPRHMLTHSKDKHSMMYTCPVENCGHRTLQKSNLATHIRTHTRVKPHKCPEYNADGVKCDFSTADPSSLHRHRKRKHGYRPQPKTQQKPKSDVQRRRRKAHEVDPAEDECESEEDEAFEKAGPSRPWPRSRRARAEAEKENENDDEDAQTEPGDDVAMSADAEEEYLDPDQDGVGEPEDETEAVPLYTMPPYFEPPFLHSLDSPVMHMTLSAPVLANISDTRTDVDGRYPPSQ